MSARLLAGAGAVLRREGLVRALDLAAGRPLGDPGAVLGFVAVLVPRRGILAPVGLGGHLGLEERVHRRVGLVGGALVVDAVRRVGEAVGRAAVLERLPDLHAGAGEVLLEREAVWKSNFGRPTPLTRCCLHNGVCSTASSLVDFDTGASRPSSPTRSYSAWWYCIQTSDITGVKAERFYVGHV